MKRTSLSENARTDGLKAAHGFARYAWGVLVYSVGVVLWGAYVRATGSGAGCGAHWPLCNGEIIPQSPSIARMVEFSHRVTSGLTLLLVIGLVVWAWRTYPRGHRVRMGAGLSLALTISEALVGAGLVLFELVAQNSSVERAISVSIHLVNTFLLLAALAVTAYWAFRRGAARVARAGVGNRPGRARADCGDRTGA